MGEIARRNHIVPRFYLKRFADGDQLTSVKLPGDKRITGSTRNASVVNNFYVMDDHPEPDVFEKELANVEAESANAFSKILDENVWPLRPDDRAMLGLFFALMYARGPERRRGMEQIASTMTALEIKMGGRENVAAWIKRERGITASEELAAKVWESATQPGGPPIRMSARAHISQILSMVDDTLKYFIGRPWSLIEFNRRSLVTSDAPVCLMNIDEPGSAVGLFTADAIVVPISRRAAILMSDPMHLIEEGATFDQVTLGGFDTRYQGTTALGNTFNSQVIAWSREWIYHHPEDAHALPDELPEPRLTEFNVPDFPETPIASENE